MVAALLPHRYWRALPVWIPVERAAFASGMLTFFAGAAIGIPGFLEHAGANVSFLNETLVTEAHAQPDAGYNRGMVQGFAGLSIFTFLFLTPTGLLTLYLLGSGRRARRGRLVRRSGWRPAAHRHRLAARRRTRPPPPRCASAGTRDALEGPEVPDRAVSSAAAGLPGCDLVIVASRRKPGWENGVTVFTADAAYRIGHRSSARSPAACGRCIR